MNTTKVKDHQAVSVILYRLKTGCQWCQLSIKRFFKGQYREYSVQKWCKCGSWERVWQELQGKYKHLLDLFDIQLDGTNTPVKRVGRETAGCKKQKKCKTSNMMILADNQGIPLGYSDHVEGNHNDVFELAQTTEGTTGKLHLPSIHANVIFLNAGPNIFTT